MAESIVIGWAEWLASREAKREALRCAGLSAPSRRTHGYGSSERRLLKTFGPARVPAWALPKEEDFVR